MKWDKLIRQKHLNQLNDSLRVMMLEMLVSGPEAFVVLWTYSKSTEQCYLTALPLWCALKEHSGSAFQGMAGRSPSEFMEMATHIQSMLGLTKMSMTIYETSESILIVWLIDKAETEKSEKSAMFQPPLPGFDMN